MGEVLKVLGQASPAAATQVDLYTVPAATQVVVSTFHICNQNAAKVKVRVRVRINGASNANSQYLLFDASVLGNDFTTFTIGMTLGAGDVVSVQSDTTLTSFQLFGTEVT